MSFAFSAGGTLDETLAGLRELDDLAVGADGLGRDLRDLLIGYVQASALPPHNGPSDDRPGHPGDQIPVYHVRASGHSQTGAPLTLTVTVEVGHRSPSLDPKQGGF